MTVYKPAILRYKNKIINLAIYWAAFPRFSCTASSAQHVFTAEDEGKAMLLVLDEATPSRSFAVRLLEYEDHVRYFDLSFTFTDQAQERLLEIIDDSKAGYTSVAFFDSAYGHLKIRERTECDEEDIPQHIGSDHSSDDGPASVHGS